MYISIQIGRTDEFQAMLSQDSLGLLNWSNIGRVADYKRSPSYSIRGRAVPWQKPICRDLENEARLQALDGCTGFLADWAKSVSANWLASSKSGSFGCRPLQMRFSVTMLLDQPAPSIMQECSSQRSNLSSLALVCKVMLSLVWLYQSSVRFENGVT